MSSIAAFLDRDGVINRRPPGGGYVTRWEDMHFLPGVAEFIAQPSRAHWLAAAGAKIDAVYRCLHETQPPCNCRKPAPGRLLAASRAHQIDLTASWMSGDSDIDVEAGKNAGCKTVRLLRINEAANGSADVVPPSLLEAICQILQRDEVITHGPAMDIATALRRAGGNRCG